MTATARRTRPSGSLVSRQGFRLADKTGRSIRGSISIGDNGIVTVLADTVGLTRMAIEPDAVVMADGHRVAIVFTVDG
jgi:hypothetical protein